MVSLALKGRPMTSSSLRKTVLLVGLSSVFAVSGTVRGQEVRTLDHMAPPGVNFDKAEFRLWYPKEAKRLQAIALLVPGSNGDGRTAVDDPVWQAFATRHDLALLGCRFVDKPHDKSFIEEYVNVTLGSGQTLLDALVAFARDSGHPELSSAPLLLWGTSAGGQFNYEFVAWKPERVIAFIVNKGGIYYSGLLSETARNVPGLFFVGENDLEFRTSAIVGLFAMNRRGGALWAFAEEPGATHGPWERTRELALIFFEEVLALRLAASSSGNQPSVLRSIPDRSGFLGDFKTKTFSRQGDAGPPNYPTAWLVTERMARAWQQFVTDKPLGP